ncbi:MAG: DUF697 domain-containing protein [Ardenticatenales bacterium]
MMGRGDMDGTGRYPDNLTPGGASWAFDWQRMRGDVRQESLCRTFFVGRRGAGKSTLCNRLCGWDLSRVAASDEPSTACEVEDFGSFVLLDLPAEDDPDGEDGLRFAVTDLMDAHLVVFVTDLTADLVPTEYRWFSQIRALGRPFVVAGNKADAVAGRLDEVQVERAHRLACSVVPVSALSGADVAERLVPRMIDACPAVAVTLGRDFSTIRRVAAQRAARQAALVSLVAALEPVPLLDIPILIATQSRLVAQLATLYGRDADGDGTRELALATASALAVRLGVQQLLKLVPVFGWLAGGALSGAFTFVLGQALIGHHERGPRPAPPSAPPSTALARRRLRDRWRSWWRDHRRPRPLRQRLRARRIHRTTGRARRIWRRRTRRESR